MDPSTDSQRDVTTVIRGLDPQNITRRIEAIDSERKALMVLLRAALRFKLQGSASSTSVNEVEFE